MFERLGSLTFRFRFLVLAAWIAGAIGCVLFAPSLAAEGMTDQSKFLPDDAPAVRARAALEHAFPGATSTSSATLSFSRAGGLTDADRVYIEDLATWLDGDEAPPVLRDAVSSVITAESRPELESMLRSADGELDIVGLNLDVLSAGSEADAVVSALRAKLAEDAAAHPGLEGHVTGAAAISGDYLAAVVKGTDSTTAVTIVLVVVILLLIYRAPLAAMVPLITIGAAFLVARGVLGILAAAGWSVSSLLDTFIVVLVFGVGTDYAIFLISRYREEVAHDNWHDAARTTVRRIGSVITASAATVIVGLGSMAFAEFQMIQTMGPALAISIFVTLIAGLTLTPALLSIFGHYLFWPLHRGRAMGDPGGFFANLAAAVSRHPGLVTIALLVVLAAPATYVTSMKTNFDVLSELPADSDARAGFDEIAVHMGRGKVVQASGVVDAGPGVDILAPASLARLRDLSVALVATEGVANVTSLVSPDGDGVVPDGLRPSGVLAEMADEMGDEGTGSDAAPGSADLLEDDATDGLETMREYLSLLGVAFPDAAARTEFRAVIDDVDTAIDQVEAVRDGAVVSTQLRSLATAMTSPSAAVGGEDGDDDSTGIIGDYLDELVAAFPGVASVRAYTQAQAAAADLERELSIETALDLSSALSTLATWFEDNRHDATLIPDSLANTPEAKRAREEIEATFDRLPVDLTALSVVFAARTDDIFVPLGLSGEDGEDLADAVDAFVSDDRTATRFYVTTDDDPYALGAFDGIRRAQDVAAVAGPSFGTAATAHVGGPTAEFADVQTVLGRDFERVGVVTVIGILIVLVILLRAVVAPLYLVATVLLSCATALGLSAWFFQEVQGVAGVSFYLPLMVFVLLVALGSDYNIFLMSRVREESEHRPIREGIRVASGRTGAVITSAGLILAGTFGSMATAELAVLFQVGVAVAVGVLIDTFLVRSILVPAITTLIGNWAWWPSGFGLAASLRSWPAVVVPGAAVPEMAMAGTGVDAGPTRVSRRRLAAVLALIILVPVTFATLFTWSLGGGVTRTAAVTAAVVNADRAAAVPSPDGSARTISLGADLAARLVASGEAAGISWVETDAADGQAGLGDGRYGALLEIPADFSTSIAALRSDPTGNAPRTTLRLTTGDGTGLAAGDAAVAVRWAIADAATSGVVEDYVSDVLFAVGGTRDDLRKAAGDADTVRSGAAAIADDAAGVSETAGELVSGLEELASGASKAGGGFDRLASGVDALATGTKKLASGATKLAAGAGGAADGADKLADGADKLADGIDAYAAGVASLPGQVEQLADGIDGVIGGVGDLADGLRAAGSQGDGLAAQANAYAESVDGYTDLVGDLADQCAALLGGSDPLCLQAAGITAGGDALDGGADGVTAMVQGLADGYRDSAHGADALADGAQPLADGAHILADEGMPALVTGADDLAAGGRKLANGAAAYATGLDQLASGADSLAKGIRQTAKGAGALADGTRAAASGAGTLTDAMDQVVDGARLVESSAVNVESSGRDVADDAEGLADRLDTAAGRAPDWPAGAPEVVGSRVADPVSVDARQLHASTTPVEALVPYFVALALWAGALAIYLLLPALGARAPGGGRLRASLEALAAAVALAIVQVALAMGGLRLVVGVETAHPLEIVGVSLLVAVVFVAITQALVATLGSRGWFIALLLLAVQLASVGWPFPIETAPAVFQALHPLLPMTYAVDALHASITGGGVPAVPVLALGAFGLVALMITLAAAVRPARRDGPGTAEATPAAA